MTHVTPKLAGAILALTIPAAGALALTGAGNTHRVSGRVTFNTSNISAKTCAGGFDAAADIRLRIHSADRRLDGTIVGHLREVANRADDAYVVAHGRFRSSSGKFGGNATLTGVDRGNDLNGIYVIRLDHGKGVIVANTSSHQDGPAGGHGEVGMDRPLAPHNSGVFATRSCSGRLP